MSQNLTQRLALSFFFLSKTTATPPTIANQRVMIDMVQNNPGDPVGWEQSKYFDPRVLKKLDYNAQTTTGEMSGTQAVDFHTLGHDFFPAGSSQRMWLDAYAKGCDRFVLRAKEQGLKAYFFVDLMVLPTFVLDVWRNATTGSGSDKKIAWNAATRELLQVLVDETFARFPDCDGWIVRTGETYVYDTPFHTGNSPSDKTQQRWVEFITFLRDAVCVGHKKDLFFRSWDNWPSDASYYLNMTNQIPTHSQLYFSIKHSSGDFVRPASWNDQLGVGQHAQIVEVELQREYEGKGSYPNYAMNGVIDGFTEMKGTNKMGLKDIIDKPQIKGLWTWTRGGGWWGPYLHGNEIWVDLHAQVLATWWTSQQQQQQQQHGSTTGTAAPMTETEAFETVCPRLLPGCTVSNGCCAAFRNFSLASAEAVLLGQWGTVVNVGDRFMRDDRMGDATSHLKGISASTRAAAVQEKATALAIQNANFALWESSIKPHVTDPVLQDKIDASIEYGVRLYSIMLQAWRIMAQGALHQNADPTFNKTDLREAIVGYDAAWSGYKAFGLAEVYAPSLYHPYYLCLGTACNCAFDPPAADLQNSLGSGIGAAVDALRNVSGLPGPPPPPPTPGSGGESCGTFSGFNCHQGLYCSTSHTTSPDFSYSGSEGLKECEAKCAADLKCTCFIHTNEPNPPLFAACKMLTMPVASLIGTERGYSAYVNVKALRH